MTTRNLGRSRVFRVHSNGGGGGGRWRVGGLRVDRWKRVAVVVPRRRSLRKQVHVESPSSALDMMLPAFAAERRRLLAVIDR